MQFMLNAAHRWELNEYPIDRVVFDEIAALADENGYSNVSIRELARRCRAGKNTVARSLVRLIKKEFTTMLSSRGTRASYRVLKGVPILETPTVPVLADSKSTNTSLTGSPSNSTLEGAEPVTGREILDLFNSLMPEGIHRTAYAELSPSERKKLVTLWLKKPDLEFWKRVWNGLTQDKWHMGKGLNEGHSGMFRMTFRYFLNPRYTGRVVRTGLKYAGSKCGTEAQESRPPSPPVQPPSKHNSSSTTQSVTESESIDEPRQSEKSESRFSANNPDSAEIQPVSDSYKSPSGPPDAIGDGPTPLTKPKSKMPASIRAGLDRLYEGLPYKPELWISTDVDGLNHGKGRLHEDTSRGEIRGNAGAGGGWRRSGLQQSASSLPMVHRAEAHSGASPGTGIDLEAAASRGYSMRQMEGVGT